MIERMKRICVVGTEKTQTQMLKALKDLGMLHLANRRAADASLLDRFTKLSKTDSELKEYADKSQTCLPLLSDEAFLELHEKVTESLEKRAEAKARRNAALMEMDRIGKWGDFNPEELSFLQENGIRLRFYQMGKKELKSLQESEEIRFLRMKPVDKQETVAVLGETDQPIPGTQFLLSTQSLSGLRQEIADCDETVAQCDAFLKEASQYRNSYQAQMVQMQNLLEDSSAGNTAEKEDGLIWLTGYIPVSDVDRFTEAAAEHAWAWCMEDVIDDDGMVPTKVNYTKLTRLMKPVFGILGTVPGYNEYDISFWFLCFFTLFFAMIIGDAAYGTLFLIAAIVLRVRSKKMSDAILLLFVLSIATIIWGALTGTWFGLENAMNVPFLKALVLPGIANYPEYFGVTTSQAQNNVMKFCFTIGVVHLALACIMNIRTKMKAKNLSWLSDLGWLSSICALYVLVLNLVIGETANLLIVAAFVILGFLLVVLFGGMSPDKTFGQGLKSGLADAFTVFLNTISAFGNVMSYIRLFAVGMASLAIAQSFNDMASGFSGILLIAGALIVILGHVLNIVMGFLSVAVHGIRLNLLEFSGQLGMEWSGTEYDPYRKLEKIRK